MTSTQYDFGVWIRSDSHNKDRYRIKYEIGQGKGLFRIQQNSGVISTPASSADVIPALTREEVAHATLIISHHGRHTFTFAETTVASLDNHHLRNWTPTQVNAMRQLELVPIQTDTHPPLPSTTQTAEKEGTTGLETGHIQYLEAELVRTKKHVQELKERVADLEDQVVELGGVIEPLILKS